MSYYKTDDVAVKPIIIFLKPISIILGTEPPSTLYLLYDDNPKISAKYTVTWGCCTEEISSSIEENSGEEGHIPGLFAAIRKQMRRNEEHTFVCLCNV